MSNISKSGRTVIGNISLSLDGRVCGPGGEYDMGWVGKHAVSDGARDMTARLANTATTVLLGRKNYQGFGGYWPSVARDPQADPRDRAVGQWLDSVEKIVFSGTLTEATWENSRIVNRDPATVVKELRQAEGGDIVVQNSRSILVQLLQADAIDRLNLLLAPEIAGGGVRLLEDDLPASSWSLTDLSTTETGALALVYDRLTDA